MFGTHCLNLWYPQPLLIYTIILLKSVCRRSQFYLDRLGRCLKLLLSTEGPFSHEFASQFGLAIFLYAEKTHKLSWKPSVCWMNQRATHRKWAVTPVTVDRSPATSWNGNNCGHSGDRLSQNGEKQQVKTATTRVYTFTAWKIWFRNYYVTYAFVQCV